MQSNLLTEGFYGALLSKGDFSGYYAYSIKTSMDALRPMDQNRVLGVYRTASRVKTAYIRGEIRTYRIPRNNFTTRITRTVRRHLHVPPQDSASAKTIELHRVSTLTNPGDSDVTAAPVVGKAVIWRITVRRWIIGPGVS